MLPRAELFDHIKHTLGIGGPGTTGFRIRFEYFPCASRLLRYAGRATVSTLSVSQRWNPYFGISSVDAACVRCLYTGSIFQWPGEDTLGYYLIGSPLGRCAESTKKRINRHWCISIHGKLIPSSPELPLPGVPGSAIIKICGRRKTN